MAMAISTQTLAESSRLLQLLFMDTVQLVTLGPAVTTGINVTHTATPAGDPIKGLVQSVSIESASEGRTVQAWSVKVPLGTPLEPGMAVMVLASVQEPSLIGKALLIDSISQNGLAMLRKGVATTFANVNQEGKP